MTRGPWIKFTCHALIVLNRTVSRQPDHFTALARCRWVKQGVCVCCREGQGSGSRTPRAGGIRRCPQRLGAPRGRGHGVHVEVVFVGAAEDLGLQGGRMWGLRGMLLANIGAVAGLWCMGRRLGRRVPNIAPNPRDVRP